MKIWKPLIAIVPVLVAFGARSQDAQPAAASCQQFMASKKTVSGKPVGQEECRMLDYGVVEPQKKLHRVDIGISVVRTYVDEATKTQLPAQ
jgi:hypothetical protein